MAANAFLPEEIILQIVTRLPVKSVGRCRCVSRQWRSLFSDPHFAKSHFHLAHKHRTLMFQHETRLQTLDFDLGDTALFDKEPLVRDLNSPFCPNHIGYIVGSCNGLVAFLLQPSNRKHESFVIWNPSTGFFKNLPGRGNNKIDFVNFGFGFVSNTHEYKLVIGDEILSSKTETWKQINRPPGAGIVPSRGVFFRDALHWLKRYPVSSSELYAFDLEYEEFSIMKLQPAALQTNDRICDVGVTCEGCFYAMFLTNNEWVYEFWVMREYGNSDSWTRSFGVKFPQGKLCSLSLRAISVSETCAFVSNCHFWCVSDDEVEEAKVTSPGRYRNEEENSDVYVIETYARGMVVYEESLCRLD